MEMQRWARRRPSWSAGRRGGGGVRRPGRSGPSGGGVGHDAVLMGPAAGDQPQRGTRREAVDGVGRERAFRVPLHGVDDEANGAGPDRESTWAAITAGPGSPGTGPAAYQPTSANRAGAASSWAGPRASGTSSRTSIPIAGTVRRTGDVVAAGGSGPIPRAGADGGGAAGTTVDGAGVHTAQTSATAQHTRVGSARTASPDPPHQRSEDQHEQEHPDRAGEHRLGAHS